MITEIRPNFYQVTYTNGVTHSFGAPNMKAAEQIVADQLARLEKRQGNGLHRAAQWRAKKG